MTTIEILFDDRAKAVAFMEWFAQRGQCHYFEEADDQRQVSIFTFAYNHGRIYTSSTTAEEE